MYKNLKLSKCMLYRITVKLIQLCNHFVAVMDAVCVTEIPFLNNETSFPLLPGVLAFHNSWLILL